MQLSFLHLDLRLDKIIHPDQTGLMSNRYIGENTKWINDIMHYTDEENIPGLLLLFDFQKAIDTISWNFIQQTLAFSSLDLLLKIG